MSIVERENKKKQLSKIDVWHSTFEFIQTLKTSKRRSFLQNKRNECIEDGGNEQRRKKK
uniref:Uncharacterized protein n=1 Tax=Arion vulgaris TaxID=1028688 RepID=A0A0B7AFP5_9EUPU